MIGFLGFSIGQYRRWTRVLMRKREDGSIETNDSEVHSGARGIYNSIGRTYELDGQLWTRLFRASHIAVMDDGCRRHDETQPTDRKWKKTAMLSDEANTNSAIARTRKRRCHCDERLRHEWSTYRWRLFGMLPLEAANT